MPKRCALGCPPLGVPTHVFPHPEKFPETFKAWVEIAGGKLETPEDYEFYRKKKICDIHFTDGDRNRNHRLNALAVPTLFLPDVKKISEPHLDEAHQRPPLISIQNLTGKPGNDSTLGISWDFTQPSTSKENQPFLNLETSISKENTSATVQGVFATSVPAALDAVESLSLKPNMPGGQLVLQEHNYSKQKYCKSKGWPTLRATKVRQRSSTSERLHQAEINNMQRKINRMTEKNKKIHARLANAEKLNNDTAFKKVTRNMTSPAKIFTKMQVTETTKKPSADSVSSRQVSR